MLFTRSGRTYSIYALFCLSSLLSAPSFAQKGQTSLGTDFWLGFMPNSFNLGCCPSQNVTLYIGSGTDNEVYVDAYGGTNPPVEHYHATLTPNSVWSVSPASEASWETLNPAERPDYKAIHVYSKKPCVVYGYQFTGANTSSTDSYLGIPTPALGTEYYTSNYYDDHYTLGPSNPLAGQFLIISPYDNNRITIGPVKSDTRADLAATTILHNKGDVWSITLMKGQSYLVQSTGLGYGDEDITGTHIVSSKPVALMSGHQLVSIPIGELAEQNGSKDEILEMLPPVSEWGSEYYDMPTATRSICGDVVRVIAGEDNEVVTATSDNQVLTGTLSKAGDYYDFEQVVDPTVFKSDGKKRFLAVQMAYSQGYLGDPGLSDPFSIVLTPRQQFQKKMIFRTPDRAGAVGFVHYGTFICQSDSILNIQLNGKPITAYEYAGQLPIPGTNPPMSARRIKFANTSTTYVATCGAPFGCYLYGWNQFESYGHPAGMALGVISPDTLPPLQAKRDSVCGSFHVQLIEPRRFPSFSFDDTKIADLALVTDPNDPRWTKPSFNYQFEWDPTHPFTPGDSIVYFFLNIVDGSKPGYAAVWTTDRAGNDTVYEYYYTAPNIEGGPSPLSIDNVWVMTDSCRNFVLKNHQSGDLLIDSIRVAGGDTSWFKLPNISGTTRIHPGDSLVLHICITPRDTVFSFDTLKMIVNECLPFQYVLEGSGAIPQIVADDVNFGSVDVGDTACKPLTVHNVGKLPFLLTKQWLLHNTKEYSFSDESRLPLTIDPGKSVTLNFCFHPDTVGAIQSRQDWATNELAPFEHSIKDTSSLLGFGRSPGLDWDRPTQDFYVQCDSQTIRMYVENTSPANTGSVVDVDSLKIVGTNASEFSIVGSQANPVFPLNPADAIWVDVRFEPDFTKGYAKRNAQLVAIGSANEGRFSPQVLLTGYVRHSTLSIAPSSYDFGKVYPGSTMSTQVWIHNEGDTELVLTNVTVDGGFYVTGFTPGEKVPPGDSVQVTVQRDSAALGIMNATLTVSNNAPCTPPASATFKGYSEVFHALATGYDYNNVYVCQDSSGLITIKNTGTEPAFVTYVVILDTLGASGAKQFAFANGTDTTQVGLALDTGQSISFKVKFNPSTNTPATAWIVYHLQVLSEPRIDTVLLQKLTGTGLHYANTVTAQRAAADTVYHAVVGTDVTVPVRLTNNFDPNAKVFGFTYKLRYKRDMFDVKTVAAAAGLTGSTNTPAPVLDPTDPTYEILTITQTSSTAITNIDVVANVGFTYMLNLDNSTPIQVSDVAFMDQAGNTVCWVTPDAIPGSFQGSDVCGDRTLRDVLDGKTPSWIQSIRPNPTRSSASVEYGIRDNNTPVKIELYDLLGKKVQTVVPTTFTTSGEHTVTIESETLTAGTYIVRLSAGSLVQSARLVVTK